MTDLQIYSYGVKPNMWTNENRQRVETPPNKRQVQLCRQWLQMFATKTKTKGSAKSSYWLKHRCENWCGEYVSNGSMIAAALDLGFNYVHKENSINIGILVGLPRWIMRPIQGF